MGKVGLFQVRPAGIYWQGSNLISDTRLSEALLERNLRNFVLPKPQPRRVLMEILSSVIFRPEVAERSLTRIRAVFNLPESITRRATNVLFVKPQEGALFLAEKGEVYTLEQIENGEVPGLGEEVIDFMRERGLNRLVIAEGKIAAPFIEIGLGGQIACDEKGMSGMKTVNWATAVARLDPGKCTGCFQCVIVCPEESIRVSDEGGEGKRPRIEIDLTNCKGCGLCSGACPPKTAAITMIGKDAPEARSLLKGILGRKRE
jgi:Pyruvate/2-oxoacid:ferredoxin oxidoreductase delta subunit